MVHLSPGMRTSDPYPFEELDRRKAEAEAANAANANANAELPPSLDARALEQTGGNVTHAARRLKISRKSLQIKMKDLGLREDTTPPQKAGES